jgi:hypothetical protein
MGWFSTVGLAVSSVASAVSSIVTDYRKYGSVYRVLEINSSEADKSLGIGENLEASLNELPDVNADHLNQFLEEPLNNIFTLYDDKKELIHEKGHLEHYINHLQMYESLLNQGDTNQEGNIQSTQITIDEYQNRIINRESNIRNNPINKLLDRE